MLITTPTTLVRNWGEERILVRTLTHCGKLLKRKAGTKGGFQFHLKEESHYLLSGRLRLRYHWGGREETVEVAEGSAWTVPPLVAHQEEALVDSVVLEISDPTLEDRVSLEPDPGGLPSMDDQAAIHLAERLSSALERRAQEYVLIRDLIRAYGIRHLLPR